MRVLIVGGGIAGLALAGLLRRQGRAPVVVERLTEYGDAGYSLGLNPWGSCVLHALGAFDAFIERGRPIARYEMVDHAGVSVQSIDMDALVGRRHAMVCIGRTDLVGLLRAACDDLPVRMGTTVTDVEQDADEVRVALSDGTRDAYDLLVACDGIHSEMRTRVLGEVPPVDTGWTAWSWWGPAGRLPPDVITEYWGRGVLIGHYPVRDRSSYVAAMPTTALPPEGADADDVLGALRRGAEELVASAPVVGTILDEARAPFRWPMRDVRAPAWSSGRVVFCGDSGTAFLPTAGVGAANALRCAAVLADELSRADAALVPLAIELYVARSASTVHANQDASRRLAHAMFVEGRVRGRVRDEIMRHYPLERIVKPIVDALHRPM